MKPRRTGFTLIELLVVIATTSVVLGAALLVLQVMFRADQRVRSMAFDRIEQQQFVRQFRADVHAARKMTLDQQVGEAGDTPGSADRLQLALDDQRVVEYRLHEDHIIRETRHGMEPPRQVTFSLTPDREQGWTRTTVETVPFVELRVHRSAVTTEDAMPAGLSVTVRAAARRVGRAGETREGRKKGVAP